MTRAILPPAPLDAQFNSYNWVDWYRKVRDEINNASQVLWTSISGKPTTVAGFGITDAATKNAQNRITSGVDTTNEIIQDTVGSGIVIRSPNGGYWRIVVSNVGAITATNLGVTKP